MKKTFIAIISMMVALFGCKEYNFDDTFTLPDVLTAEEEIVLDVTSAERVTFYWSGGGATDGGLLLYEVLFDRAGGNFSSPLMVFQSDKGSQSRLTLTQAQMNSVAVAAGLRRRESGDFIWTVRASKGGISRLCEVYKPLNITRGDGIDEIPSTLTIGGEGSLEENAQFIQGEPGVFSIITKLQAGGLYFASGEDRFYPNAKGVLIQGDNSYEPDNIPESGIARVVVNFNTLSVTIDQLSTTVKAHWAANGSTFLTLKYKGEGLYSGTALITLLGPGRPGTPSWCSWTEERYAFMTEVNGMSVRWGSCWPDPDGANSANFPSHAEDYYLYEVVATDWGSLWKLDHGFDLKTVRMSIFLDETGHLTHSIVESELDPDDSGDPDPDPDPDPNPGQTYTLTGTGAEVQGQALVDMGDNVYRVYAKISEGGVTVTDGTNNYDFEVDATPEGADASRLTFDLSTNSVTVEVVNKVRVLYAADFNDIVTLTYQGQGVWSGNGGVWFRDMGGWYDERYYFIPTIDGQQSLCWGRKDSVDQYNRPDGDQAADYFDCAEFGWSQWEHCWKLASNTDCATNGGKNTTITLNTNSDGIMTHSVVVDGDTPGPDPVQPFTLTGTGAEVQGQALIDMGNNVYRVYAKISEGGVTVTNGTDNYNFDVDATPEGADASRLTFDLTNNTVTAVVVNKVRVLYAADFNDIVTLTYQGQGVWSGTGGVWFRDMGGWYDERYYFIPTTDGQQTLCWGRKDSVDQYNRPDGNQSADYFDCDEFGWSQWEHCWKLASNTDCATNGGKNSTITLNTNQDGVMTHSVIVED